MLALNETFQKVGEEAYGRFRRVRYALSGAISALFTEKADVGLMIPGRSNLLIQVIKIVGRSVVGVELLEYW